MTELLLYRFMYIIVKRSLKEVQQALLGMTVGGVSEKGVNSLIDINWSNLWVEPSFPTIEFNAGKVELLVTW